jgi:hypothetical protein
VEVQKCLSTPVEDTGLALLDTLFASDFVEKASYRNQIRELPTTQSSNPSPLKPGTEIFDAETNPQSGPSAKQRPPTETDGFAKSPHSGAINAKWLMKVSTQGLGGGDSRARTGDPPPSHRTGLRLRRERDFRPQRQRLKCRLFAGRRLRTETRRDTKAPIPARQCDKGAVVSPEQIPIEITANFLPVGHFTCPNAPPHDFTNFQPFNVLPVVLKLADTDRIVAHISPAARMPWSPWYSAVISVYTLSCLVSRAHVRANIYGLRISEAVEGRGIFHKEVIGVPSPINAARLYWNTKRTPAFYEAPPPNSNDTSNPAMPCAPYLIARHPPPPYGASLIVNGYEITPPTCRGTEEEITSRTSNGYLRKCRRCNGKGYVRGPIDWFIPVFTVGLTALADLEAKPCRWCEGDGYLSD